MKKIPELSSYKESERLSPNSRVFVSLLNALILVILHFVLLVSSMEVMKAIPSFKERVDMTNASRIECYMIEEEAKLFEFEGEGDARYEKPVSLDTTFERYLGRQVLRSYEHDSSAFVDPVTEKAVDPHEKIRLGKATYENDTLAYFYVTYVPSVQKEKEILDYGELSPREYYVKLLASSLKNDASHAAFDETTYSDYPALLSGYAYKIYRYLFLEESNYQEGLTCYNYLKDAYSTIWQKSTSLLFASPAYSEAYSSYIAGYSYSSYMMDIVALLSYFVAYLLTFILPYFIFRKERQNLGQLAFKGITVYENGDKENLPLLLKREALGFLLYLPSSILTLFFSTGLSGAAMFPLFTVGKVGISYFHVLCFLLILPLINVIVLYSSKEKRSLLDKWTRSSMRLKELPSYVSPIPTKEEEKPLKNEGIQPVLKESGPYFDSSSFRNEEREPKGE